MNKEQKEAEEKRFRIQWNKNFCPEMISKTKIKEQPQQDKFDGGDEWEKDGSN